MNVHQLDEYVYDATFFSIQYLADILRERQQLPLEDRTQATRNPFVFSLLWHEGPFWDAELAWDV